MAEFSFELFPFVVLNAFNIGLYAYVIIGHTRADQLLPQLLMEQFDTGFSSNLANMFIYARQIL